MNKMSIDVIVKNHKGDIIKTLLALRLHIKQKLTALMGAIFAKELEHQNVELEGDSN